MKITDAYWEKRNLGVETTEVEIELQDEINEVRRQLERIKSSYCVIKVPSECMDIVGAVQKEGFMYIEDMILVSHDLHEVVRSKMHQRLYEATAYRRMNEQDIEQLFDEVQQGMFANDRITNDGAFTKEQAARRYRNWIADLIAQGAEPYVVLYKDDPAGFVILKELDAGIYDSVLGGGYQKYRKSGMGIIQKEQEIVKRLGGKAVQTRVSSNNLNQLKALILNGYVPKKIEHVFIRHVDGR